MKNKQFDVLAIGELNVDLIMNQINGFPVIGKEIEAKAMDLTLGSSTAIFAANLSALGSRVGFLGKTGNDLFGELVRKSLSSKGIDISMVTVDPKVPTGATIILNYDQDRAMITFPGAMQYLTIDDINDEILSQANHVHFSSLFLQPGIRPNIDRLFKRAKKLGLTTSLDIQWDPEESWDFDYRLVLPLVDVFLPNEGELLHLAGKNDLYGALEKVGKYANHIAVKRGSKGALLFSFSGEIIEKPAYQNNKVVDAIGAGDSFNAGFLFKFVQGAPLDECLNFGNLTGALNTTAAGGTGAFLSKKHIMNTLKEKFDITVDL
ncbi:MAG: carbohydrate kinase family protein [Prolixibacteraceae bacterium]|jgi:sugar/nucleoside kinase (ribokinase family)|nr:carbohydrate kinase family protein [Prolixibacteraceae bacterium]